MSGRPVSPTQTQTQPAHESSQSDSQTRSDFARPGLTFTKKERQKNFSALAMPSQTLKNQTQTLENQTQTRPQNFFSQSDSDPGRIPTRVGLRLSKG